MSDTKTKAKTFSLPVARLSYPNLFKARAMEGDDGKEKTPEFSASFILDKKLHKDLIAKINAEAKKVAIGKWGKVPGKFRYPVRDGNTFIDNEATEDPDEPVYKDGYGPGVVAINAKSRNKQHCVLRDKSPAEESDLYGGCYVNAVISLYPWFHKKNGYGVSANLGPVQFVKNGERFGGQVIDADEAFEDLGEDDDGDEPAPKKKPGKKSRPADDDDDPTADI